MRIAVITRMLLIVLFVMAATAIPVLAQESRTVEISGGRVSINGTYLDDDAVPRALREFDGQVSFTFSGEEDPVLGFGETLYRIESDRIVELPASSLKMGGFLHAPVGPNRIHVTMPAFDSTLFAVHLPEMHVFRSELLDSMRLVAESLVVVDADMMRRNAERMRELADEIRLSVPPPGGRIHIARAPSLWDDFGDDLDFGEIQPLRRHLLREQELDAESHRIARELRNATSDQLRAELEADLRSHLEEVFELRQENRRAEIKELEGRLEELRDRLERREELRERIIEERLEFLKRESVFDSDR